MVEDRAGMKTCRAGGSGGRWAGGSAGWLPERRGRGGQRSHVLDRVERLQGAPARGGRFDRGPADWLGGQGGPSGQGHLGGGLRHDSHNAAGLGGEKGSGRPPQRTQPYPPGPGRLLCCAADEASKRRRLLWVITGGPRDAASGVEEIGASGFSSAETSVAPRLSLFLAGGGGGHRAPGWAAGQHRRRARALPGQLHSNLDGWQLESNPKTTKPQPPPHSTVPTSPKTTVCAGAALLG